jgi:hypothetical protein
MYELFVLLILFLFAALMFILYRYGRKNKPRRFRRKDLLRGYDSISRGSPWSSSSMTKGTGKNHLKVVGGSHDQDALEEIFRPRTDEGVKKTAIATIIVEDDNPEE